MQAPLDGWHQNCTVLKRDPGELWLATFTPLLVLVWRFGILTLHSVLWVLTLSLLPRLFQICTGKSPFSDLVEGSVILRVIKGERPKRPTSDKRNRSMSDNLWDLVELCWQQKLSDRPNMQQILKQMLNKSTASGLLDLWV